MPVRAAGSVPPSRIHGHGHVAPQAGRRPGADVERADALLSLLSLVAAELAMGI
jgi:hypothetical protein